MKRTEREIYEFVKRLLKESKQREKIDWLLETLSQKERYKQEALEEVLNFIGTIRSDSK